MNRAAVVFIVSALLFVKGQPTNEIDVVTKLLADLKGSS
jgi:hypothetical protein